MKLRERRNKIDCDSCANAANCRGKMFQMFQTRRNYLRIPISARTVIPAINNLLCLRILILQAKKSCTKAEVMPYSEAQNHINAYNVRNPQSYQELENIDSQHVPNRVSKCSYSLKRLCESVNRCRYEL